MKKFLTIMALAGLMAACNNGDDETKDDDTMMTDTSTVAPMDTTSMGDTSHMGTMGDTTAKMK
ncbi:MAG TPA: hypothetical protein VF145_14145 [Chitinophagaceae bacterium]